MTVAPTEPLFRDDPYLAESEAVVLVVEGDSVILDRTVFYAESGGQPGDSGRMERDDGESIEVVDTRRGGADRNLIAHVLAPETPRPAVGERVRLRLDWARRYRHMRMHTALHLLSVALPYPVTGGQIGAAESRLDFDIPEAGLDREAITEAVNALVAGEHPVTAEWISEAELDANPELVKTMSVKPPRGAGRVRLIRIGEAIDLQPCGGTHVSNTLEIGPVEVSKIEKKGRQNRRVRLRLRDES